MLRAMRAEVTKLKGSAMPAWTALVVLLIPLAVFTPIRYARTAVPVGWATFMRAGPQLTAAYGAVLFGFVAAYVFGREYTEGTTKEMFTLPVRREYFVLAKAVVLAGWVLGLTVLSLLAQAGYAALLGLHGFSWANALDCLRDGMAVAVLIFGTLPIVVLLAIRGRGYVAPMVYSAVMACVGLGLAEAGWGAWFPWAVPASVTGIVLGPPIPMGRLEPGSWALMALLFAAGTAAVLWQVDVADEAA
jgi:ABC-2 type transport system permease protein